MMVISVCCDVISIVRLVKVYCPSGQNRERDVLKTGLVFLMS